MTISKRITGVVLLLTCLFVAMSPSILSAQKEGGTSFIQTDPNAQGTRFNGTLAVYYQRLDNPFARSGADQCLVAEANLYFFLRLSGQKQLFGFSALEQSSRDAKICFEDFSLHDQLFRAFFQTKVIPFLASKGLISSPTATFAVRSVTNLVQEVQAGDFGGSLAFSMMDLEAAIK